MGKIDASQEVTCLLVLVTINPPVHCTSMSYSLWIYTFFTDFSGKKHKVKKYEVTLYGYIWDKTMGQNQNGTKVISYTGI